jgi:hypothetical protein
MRRKDNDCFCSSSDIKCWWHALKDVKVTNSMKKMDENVDLKTILDSLPMKIDENVDLETILDSLPTSKCVFGLALDIIDFDRIDYGRIDFIRIDFSIIDLCLDTVM